MYSALRNLLFQLPAETAHELGLIGMELSRMLKFSGMLANRLKRPTEFLGHELSNPVGIAAGLDKNADYIDALAAMGFGFVEVGTVTPRPQMGNPKPRLFRLKEDQAIINRMGFNNKGVDYLVEKVKRRQSNITLGINIGKNKDTPNEKAADDYLHCLDKVYQHADYVVINVSSPNTQGLRDLQQKDSLIQLLSVLKERQAYLFQEYRKHTPLMVKVAPDLSEDEIAQMSEAFLQAELDGCIISNTTIARPHLLSKHANEQGGLSGGPLKPMSDQALGYFADQLRGKMSLIGVGGIMKGQDAIEKFNEGVDLVQVYSGFIYKGPELITEIIQALNKR